MQYPCPNHIILKVELLLFTIKTSITHKSYSFDPMEYCDFSITTSKIRPKDHFILIYRPPNLSTLAFLHNLATVLEGNSMESGQCTILGNLNIKINDTHVSDSMLLLDFLDSFDLSNKATFPPNRQSNPTDLII